MLVTGTPPPIQPPGNPRPQAGSAAAPKRATVDPEVRASLARAEDAADKSKTSRRDALASELTRLMSVARELNRAGGDLRSTADALQDIARQIAKVARALADAERALPAAQRRGTPPVAIPRAAAGPPAPAESAVASEADATAAASASTLAGAAPAEAKARGDDSNPAGSPAAETAGEEPPADPDDPLDPARRAEEREARARAGRSGTGELLKLAAGLLDDIRKTVRKAELFENLLDPEAARERAKAGAEIEGYANDLRNLAASFADPAQGLGLDVSV